MGYITLQEIGLSWHTGFMNLDTSKCWPTGLTFLFGFAEIEDLIALWNHSSPFLIIIEKKNPEKNSQVAEMDQISHRQKIKAIFLTCSNKLGNRADSKPWGKEVNYWCLFLHRNRSHILCSVIAYAEKYRCLKYIILKIATWRNELDRISYGFHLEMRNSNMFI